MVKGDWVKPGAVVIDVGIHKIDGKIEGDVDTKGLDKKIAYIASGIETPILEITNSETGTRYV